MTPTRHRIVVGLTVLPLIAIFFFGVSILHHRSWRLDLTPDYRHTLSERARRVLGELPPGTRVHAFLRSQDARNMALRDLLRQMESAAPTLVTDVVDVNRTPALALEYGVRGVAFVLEADGRRRVVSNPSEDTVVAGALELMRGAPAVVGWVVGHGEGDAESGERRTGFARLRQALELEHRQIRFVTLREGGLAGNLDAVLIAAPRGDYLPDELLVLDRYLRTGGNLLVLLDAGRAPALAAFLGEYGIRLEDDVVLDPKARLYGGEPLTIRLSLDQRLHPIVRSLASPPLFSRARSVDVDPSAGGVEGVTFLFGSDASFATPRPPTMDLLPDAPVRNRDRVGPVPVGVEVRFAAVAEGTRRPARLVVLGSGDFATNFFIDFLGNKDLVLNAVGWLVHDEDTMGHRPARQRPGVNQFFVSEEEGARVWWIAVVLQPGTCALVGFGLVLWRRWR